MPPIPIQTILAELNEQQRLAVEHGDEPLLIVAGAGTGKTATLAHRVAYRIATGTDPGRILLLTFTRRAAAEMLRRVEGILRRLEAEAAGAERRARTALRRGQGLGRHLPRHRHPPAPPARRSIGLDPAFTILDRGDAEDLMGVLRTDLGLAKNDRRFPLKGTCMDIYSRCVNARETVEEAVETHFPWCKDEVEDLRKLFAAYVDRKGEQSVLDYDDLLLFWHGLLTDARAARSIRGRFDCVLVDEYQDTNVLQAEILQMLCPGGKNLTVVGDDAQAIYSFRAATVRNILDFPRQFPGTTMVTLEQNYRSTQPILDATNDVIAAAAERHAKNLWSRRRGRRQAPAGVLRGRGRAERVHHPAVLDHREAGIPLRRQAVLFRASHHSLALELELSRRNIPFHKYGGLRFVETAHVKDLLAFLRLAENPRDLMAGTRVLMLLPGVGPKKARALMDDLAAGTPGAAAPPADWRSHRGATPATPAGPSRRAFVRLRRLGRPPRPFARRGHGLGGSGGAHDRHRESRAGGSRLPDQTDQALLCASARAPLRQRPRPHPRPRAARGAGRPLPRPGPLPRRDRPRPAQLHRGPGRPAPARRGLPHPLHHALGQGSGVGRASSSSTPPTATSPPTWPPAGWKRSRRSAGCSTWP